MRLEWVVGVGDPPYQYRMCWKQKLLAELCGKFQRSCHWPALCRKPTLALRGPCSLLSGQRAQYLSVGLGVSWLGMGCRMAVALAALPLKHACLPSPVHPTSAGPHPVLYVITSFQSSPRQRRLSTYSVPGPVQGTEDMHPRLK